MRLEKKLAGLVGIGALAMAQGVMAECRDVDRADLEAAVATVAAAKTGGYGLDMWVTMVDETGKVCHVVTSSKKSGALIGNSQWLGSRVISAQKAFTANAFSLDGYAISTANLYSAVQPGGSLFGLQHSNPVDASLAYKGSPNKFGTKSDPLVGKTIGGINVFGGGLALYHEHDGGKKKVGAIGVSGDTSCRDHAFAWNVRANLHKDHGGMHPTAGITTVNMDFNGAVQTPLVTGLKGDEMIIDAQDDTDVDYWDAWSQPACPNSLGTDIATTGNGTVKN